MPQHLIIALRHFLAWISLDLPLERTGQDVSGTVFDGGGVLHRPAWQISLEEKMKKALTLALYTASPTPLDIPTGTFRASPWLATCSSFDVTRAL